jgi:hypothetical protein
MKGLHALVSLLVVSATLVAAAQAPVRQAAPARDAEVQPTVGSASIAGLVVTDEETPRPVRRVLVTLAGGELRPSRGAITDDNGRFAIAGLPAGSFTLTVSKAAYITSLYGAKRPGRPGTAIAVADGARVDNLVVRLWRGAAVAGVVRDESGAPVAGIPVTAIRARRSGGTVLTLSNNGTLTNDRGEYRIFGLEPGSYVVQVRPGSSGGGPMMAMSEAEVDAALARIARRGAGPSDTSRPAPDAPPPVLQPFEYSPVYHPGTATLAQATTLALDAGDDAAGIDITLQRVATATIDGVVTRPDGAPAAGTTLQLEAVVSDGPFVTDTTTIDATAGADGSFRIAQVTPGQYRLVARAPITPAPPPSPRGGLVTPPTALSSLWAVADVAVVGSDISGLSLALGPGVTVSGRIAFDGKTLAPPADLTQFRVWLMLPEMDQLRPGTPIRSIAFAPPVQVRADGSFSIENILPDTYQLRVVGSSIAADGWWPRSAVAGGRDLLDGQVTIAPGADVTGLVVTLSDRHTELSGRLLTADGGPASDVFVIAYAADRRYWGTGSRRVKAVRPDISGRYAITDLPPGEYRLGAVVDAEPDDWQNPDFLEKLVGASITISIGEGEHKQQDIRMAK